MFPAGVNRLVGADPRVDNFHATQVELHEMYKLVLGGNYKGPVREILSSKPYERVRGLDIGCSTPWAEDMAQEFPHVQWYGVDTLPTQNPRTNSRVQYNFYDFKKGLLFKDGYFDIIHARNTISMIPNYPAFLREIKRILKPGGLFLFTNSEPYIFLTSRTKPSHSIPACVRMQAFCAHLLARHRIQIKDPSHLPVLIKQVGGFKNDSARHGVICVPNGDWDRKSWTQREIGLKSLQCILGSLSSAKGVFRRELGMSEDQFDELARSVRNELEDPDIHTFHHYHTFYAIRE